MKKFMFYCAAALTLIMGMAACGNDDGVVVSVDSETIEFTAAGGTETVAVTGEGWTTSENSDWFRVEDFEDSFKVTADVNPIATAREGVITVTNNAGAKTVTVKQAAAGDGISVDALTLTFEGQAGTQTVTVTSEIAAWSATPAADSDWITVTPDTANMTFTVTVTANVEDEQRQGTITVGNGKEETTITVTQGTIEWYEFVDVRARYDDSSDTDTLGEPWLQFWGSKVNSAFQPAEDCWNISLSTVIPEPDLTGTAIDLPTGTYDWKTSGSSPAINGLDRANNYLVYIRNQVSDMQGLRDIVGGSSMIVEKTGDNYNVKTILTLADGSIFKGIYTGKIVMDNPGNTGLVEDVDFGVLAGEGTGRLGTLALHGFYSFSPTWAMRICSPGLTRDAETNTFTGSGYFMRIHSTMGGNGWIMPDGTYEVGPTAGNGIHAGKDDDIANDSGTWFYKIENGEIVDKGSVKSGTIKITCNDSNPDTSASQNIPTSYTFEIDVTEGLGFAIKGTFTAECDWIDIGTINNI